MIAKIAITPIVAFFVDSLIYLLSNSTSAPSAGSSLLRLSFNDVVGAGSFLGSLLAKRSRSFTVPIREKSGDTEDYLVIDRPEGFVAAAQMGAIEFHVWGARTDNLEKPDRVVFDLDPGDGVDFDAVRHAAKAVRDVFG